MNIFPMGVRSMVIPEVIPKSEKAATDSKTTDKNERFFSLIRRRNVIIPIHKMARVIMVIARNTCAVLIFRLRMKTDSLPDITARAVARNMANVVVLMPLPVDPGDDPITLIPIIMKMVAN